MTRERGFLRGNDGSISVDWLEMTAGSIALGVMATFAILNGSIESWTADSSGATAWTSADVATVTALDSVDAEALQLTERISLPVGSMAVHSEDGFASFRTPAGGWVDAWTKDGPTIPEGATLTSIDSFTLSDGSIIAASALSATCIEAYSSSVRFSFQNEPGNRLTHGSKTPES